MFVGLIVWCHTSWYDSVLNNLFQACSILSLQRELIAESESDHLPADINSLPLSQERLIRKAAGLSYFLINEVMVAPVRLTNFQRLFIFGLSDLFPDLFSPLHCLSEIFKPYLGIVRV